MMSKKGGVPTRSTQDPLRRWRRSRRPARLRATRRRDVSFPRILSDDASRPRPWPREGRTRHLVKQDEPLRFRRRPPPVWRPRRTIACRWALPVGTLSTFARSSRPPRDALTDSGSERRSFKTDAELAPKQRGGSSSSRNSRISRADRRSRLCASAVPRVSPSGATARRASGIGTHGPFRPKLEALKYKERFERTERIVLLIDPDR